MYLLHFPLISFVHFRYQNLETFIIDVNLVFDNCEKFNEDNSDIGRAGHNMRKFFEKRWTELLKQTNWFLYGFLMGLKWKAPFFSSTSHGAENELLFPSSKPAFFFWPTHLNLNQLTALIWSISCIYTQRDTGQRVSLCNIISYRKE